MNISFRQKNYRYLIAFSGQSNQSKNSVPLIWWMRKTASFMRVACSVTLVVFLNACLFPYALMAQEAIEQQQESEKIVLTGSAEEQLNEALIKVQDIASETHQLLAERLEEESGLWDAVLGFVGLSQL